MKKLLREPLIHFLLLGAALFAVSGTLVKGTGSEPGKITVSQARIEHLATGFALTWLRAPTAEELEGLVRNYIREEIYYREAMAMGLDRDDTIIRRRLQQKLELVFQNMADLTQATDEELRVFLQDHPEKFRLERRFTFRQVFLSPEHHRESLAGDAADVLRQLKQTGESSDGSTPGDPSLLENQFADVEADEVAKQFGEKFASALNDLPLGEWQGPLESTYGVHLVFVDERAQRRTPTLEEVRDAVRREWSNARQLESTQKFYDGLLKRYTVIIEPAPPNTGDAKTSTAR
ncbi:MAG TPA: peptidyl-prolyl cis-trans isomerase [Xanthobacteraceae bacterium]